MDIVSENMNTSLDVEVTNITINSTTDPITNTTTNTMSSFCNLKAFGVSDFTSMYQIYKFEYGTGLSGRIVL